MQPSQSRISIVMITQNRAPEVLCSLGHLTALAERPEIILVDNGSTDDTRQAGAQVATPSRRPLRHQP